MNIEEHGAHVWQAGDIVPAGIYLRVDDASFRVVNLEQEDRLPASYDGHVALYRRASAICIVHPRSEPVLPATKSKHDHIS